MGIGEIDIKKEILEAPGNVMYAAKIRNSIVKKYGLVLDDHENQSMGKRIANCLSQMYDQGILGMYSDGAPIKYIRRR